MPWADNNRWEIFPEVSWSVRDSTLQKQEILKLRDAICACPQQGIELLYTWALSLLLRQDGTNEGYK